MNKNIDSKLGELEANVKELENVGRKLQENGAKLVEYANTEKQQVKFFKTELPKYLQISKDYPQMLDHLPINEDWITHVNNEISYALEYSRSAKPLLMKAILCTSTVSSTLSTAGSAAISGEVELEIKYPEVNFQNIYNLENPQLFLDTISDKEISTMLESYDPKLEEKRKGAWQTFYSSSEDRLSQAANSMRELLRLFISKYASNDNVKKTSWWTYEPDTEDGVSIKQRIRYLIYGGESKSTTSELLFIENQVNSYKKDFKLLNEIAHGGICGETVVESSMKAIEQLILLILQRYKSSRSIV